MYSILCININIFSNINSLSILVVILEGLYLFQIHLFYEKRKFSNIFKSRKWDKNIGVLGVLEILLTSRLTVFF